jgi:hypothetical protein
MLFSAKIGAIEFVENEVRVAVVKTGGRRPVLLEVQSRTAVYGEADERVPALAQALGEAVDGLKYPPTVFILCASGLYSVVRAITIPIRGRKRVLAAAQFELEPHLAFPIEELLLDFNLVAEVDGETEVLAVGVRRNHLEDQMAILAAAGIEVDAVNLDAVAMTGLWQAGRKAQKGLQAVLHVRDHCSSLVVLFNGTIAYFRNMTHGAQALAEQPGLVARDVQNTLRAFLAKWRGGGEIAALEVTGLELTPGLSDALSEVLHLPVTAQVMLARVSGGAKVLAGSESTIGPNTWEAVIGAAFSGAGGVLALNFDRSERGTASRLRAIAPHLVYSSALSLAALLLWGGYYYLGASQYRAEAALLQKEIDGLNTEIEALSKKGLGENINVDLFGDPAALELLADISQRMPGAKVTVLQVEFAPPGARSGWLTLSGTASSAENVNAVMEELAKSTLYKVDPNPKLSSEGDQITFTVRAFRMEEEEEETSDGSK